MHWVALAFFTSLLYWICRSHVLRISIFGVSAALAGYRKKVQEWQRRSIADLMVELSVKFQFCASVLAQTALPKQIYLNIIKWRYQVLDNTRGEGLRVSCYQPEFIFHKFQNYFGIKFNIFKMVTFLQNTMKFRENTNLFTVFLSEHQWIWHNSLLNPQVLLNLMVPLTLPGSQHSSFICAIS